MINDSNTCGYKWVCNPGIYLFAFRRWWTKTISALISHTKIISSKVEKYEVFLFWLQCMKFFYSGFNVWSFQALDFGNLSTVFSVDKFTKWRHSALFEQEIINAVQLHGLYLKFISFCVIIPCAMTSWTTSAFRQPLTVLYRGKAENINVEKISLIFLATTAF